MDSKENGNFILKPWKRNETNPNILKFLFPVTYEKYPSLWQTLNRFHGLIFFYCPIIQAQF